MRKIYIFIVALATLMLADSCKKNGIEKIEDGKVTVEISIADFVPTPKSLKSSWESGDLLNIYLDDASSYIPDIQLVYNGSKWEAAELQKDVIARLKTSGGKIKGFWEASNSAISNEAWDKWETHISFPDDDKRETTGQKQYHVAEFKDIAYNYSEGKITASVENWIFRANIQIVVSGLTPGSYALYGEEIYAFSSISVDGKDFLQEHSTGASARIAGIENPDGVAFVTALSTDCVAGTPFELFLIDNNTGKTYKYSKALAETIYDDTARLQSLVFPFSQFTLVP